MSAPSPVPPSREQNQKKLVDIIRIGHDSLDREHTKLQEAILGIYKFQTIPSDPKTGNIYQYELENQSQFDKHEVVITSALGTFEPVVNESKEKLFRLEMQIPKTPPLDMPMPQAPLTEKKKGEPDTRSLMEKIKGTPEKSRIVTPDDPYQDGLKYLREIMAKMDRFERFVEYQAYGVDLGLRANFTMMQQYLQFHRTRFKFEIAPTILKVHRQYIEIIKEREKQGAVQFAKKLDEEIFQTRNDFMMQPPK